MTREQLEKASKIMAQINHLDFCNRRLISEIHDTNLSSEAKDSLITAVNNVLNIENDKLEKQLEEI